ncbi:hypothetical protein B0H10DRAFT_534231 [Mycena sp. CBHHK59/15]|nr:hypothetical protein B0H10DRAFT_534231 [Mycena sp. CBHHK59/15]
MFRGAAVLHSIVCHCGVLPAYIHSYPGSYHRAHRQYHFLWRPSAPRLLLVVNQVCLRTFAVPRDDIYTDLLVVPPSPPPSARPPSDHHFTRLHGRTYRLPVCGLGVCISWIVK